MKGVEKYIRQEDGRGYLVFEIDQSKAEYKGLTVRDLGSFGRRKFENLIFLQEANDHFPMKFIYH